ncbi:MAG TPA: hypothetical protein VFT50_09400 [Baekduia sp.]|nr:hypothetical protein [Baekduia sp.]
MQAPEVTRAQVQKRTRKRVPPPPPPPAAALKAVRDSIDGRRSPAPPPPSRQFIRGQAREHYAEQTPQQRKEARAGARGGRDPVSHAVTKLHDDWMRSKGYVDQALKWIKDGSGPVPEGDRTDISKGLQVIRHLGDRQRTANRHAIGDMTDAALKFGKAVADTTDDTAKVLEHAPEPKKQGLIGGVIDHIPSPFGPSTNAGLSLAGQVSSRIEGKPPLDPGQLNTLRGVMDATSRALEQTSRVSSASAGGALALKHGDNVLKGAGEGFVKNDKSYTQLAKELGLKGVPAAVAGTIGDILLDPTTYLSFGAKTPAEAAELAARTKLARELAPAARKAADAGNEAELRRIAEKWDREIEAARASASRLESGTRGIQAGFRIPGLHIPKIAHVEGRTVATSGRASAAAAKRTTAPLARKVQQSRPVNELLRKFSPAQTPTDLDALAHREFRHIEREASALENKLARDGRQLGRLIARTTKGGTEEERVAKIRQVKDAIETGTVDQLPKDLRNVAEHAQRFHETVAAKYEEITGKPLDLLGTVLKKGEVEDALKTAREVLHDAAGKLTREGKDYATQADRLGQRIAVDDAKLAARMSERTKWKPNRAAPAESLPQALRKFEHAALANKASRTLDDAEKLAGRLDDVGVPRTIDEQQATAQRIVSSLSDVMETVRAGVRTNVARGRTNDVLGAVRRGEVDNGELARALADNDRLTAEVRQAKAAGNRQAARAAEAKLRQARAVIRRHRDEIHAGFEREIAAQPVPLRGKAGRLEDQLDGMIARLAEPAPVGYVPRKPQVYAEAMLDPKAMRKAPLAVRSQAQAGPEMARVDRRMESAIREDPNVPDELKPSDELATLEAKYGAVMGRRLANLSIYKAVVERFSAPASTRVLHEAEGSRIFHVDRDGKLTEVPKDREAEVIAQAQAIEARAAEEGVEPVYEHIVVPEGIAKQLDIRAGQHGERGYFAEKYDAMLRAFKAANTILRPGFFATSVLGNTWQGFLVDAGPEDFANAFRVWAHLRSTTAEATKPGSSLMRRIWDAASPSGPEIVDGRPMTFGDLYDEALEYGAQTVGSRIGDPMELSLERQAQREIAGGAVTRGVEWLNQLAEDVDGVTRMMLYRRARVKLGYSPRQATEYVFSTMIDYGDLSPFERRVMKRVMPFYVYTSRNLPIQIRRLLERPGKLATFEKVRQNLATAAGLPQDWESMLAEGDQERMPFPVPGLKLAGHQFYEYLRLPVEDISRPLQALEGPSGLARMGERYAGDMAPFIKMPLELHFNRRFDFDRPISLPGSPPTSGALERFLGLAESGQHTNLRTGAPFHGADPRLDYALRAIGGSLGAAALNFGKETPDTSGVPAPLRTLLSTVAGQGANAPDPLQAVALPQVGEKLQNLYDERTDLSHRPGGQYSEEWYRLQRKIDAERALRDVVRAAIGYPDAKKNLPKMRMDRVNRILSSLKTPAQLAAEHKIRAILNP